MVIKISVADFTGQANSKNFRWISRVSSYITWSRVKEESCSCFSSPDERWCLVPRAFSCNKWSQINLDHSCFNLDLSFSHPLLKDSGLSCLLIILLFLGLSFLYCVSSSKQILVINSEFLLSFHVPTSPWLTALCSKHTFLAPLWHSLPVIIPQFSL